MPRVTKIQAEYFLAPDQARLEATVSKKIHILLGKFIVRYSSDDIFVISLIQYSAGGSHKSIVPHLSHAEEGLARYEVQIRKSKKYALKRLAKQL